MKEQTEATKLTVLEAIRGEWVKNSKPNPTKKQMEELARSLTNARNIRKRAEEELVKAEDNMSRVYMELAKATGARSIKLDGVLYTFSSRGEKVFLKSVTSEDVVEL